MSDFLDRFAEDLDRAQTKRIPKRRRARVAVTFAVTGVAAVGGAAIGAAARDDGLDPLALVRDSPTTGRGSFGRPDTSPALTLTPPEGARHRWKTTIYRSHTGTLCHATASTIDPRPGYACRAGFNIADEFQDPRSGRLPVDLGDSIVGTNPDGTRTFLVAGGADESVARVTVTTSGSRTPVVARRADGHVDLDARPTEPGNLTAEGRALAARLPKTLRLHLVAAPITVGPRRAKPRVTVTATLGDGTMRRYTFEVDG